MLTALLAGGSAMAQVVVSGNVYGGGNLADVKTDATVTISAGTVENNVFGGGNEADVTGNVTVTMTGGTVNKDVYGGGALANTNIGNVTAGYGTDSETISSTSTNTTKVYLNGGVIKGDAYGGGLGRMASGDDPDAEGYIAGVEAKVYGDITVYLGGDADGATAKATEIQISKYDGEHASVVKSGRIFGTNNLNGSPKGDVTVHVYKTVTYKNDGTANTKPTINTNTFELAAVYGGGNLANFTTTGKSTHVWIHTCDVSVESVYGGGNAAAVPATDVHVEGAHEIQYVFGGGNGKDPYTLDGTDWIPNRGANVNGNATTELRGGYIHEAYGGSNEKGTISGSATMSVNDANAEGCPLNVVKLVGAGRNADIDGDAILVLGCMPETKIDQIFGGADNANVKGNVELTITSGNFRQVFGGNNAGGMINGHIKLNIEETGCRAINIDELYLGGNQAAYSVYGYYDSGQTDSETGKPIYLPRLSADDNTAVSYPTADATHSFPFADPVLNVISCTSIGKVYGGGLGSEAKMHGSPTVNINMIPGVKAEDIKRTNNTANAHDLGSIGDVYGGGAQADVYGKATVNIGTATTVELTSVDDDDSTAGVDEKHPNVEGAYITGKVYGGGQAADINGDTEVNIGTIAYTTTGYEGVKLSNDVFGGGEGSTTTVSGDVTVNLGSKTTSGEPPTATYTGNASITGNVYGGSALGDVNATKGSTYASDPTDIAATSGKETKVNIYSVSVTGNVFGGGLGRKNDPDSQPDVAAQNFGATTVTMENSDNTKAVVSAAVYGGANVNGVLKGSSTVEIISGTIGTDWGETPPAEMTGRVFGGGLGQATLVNGSVTVNIGLRTGTSPDYSYSGTGIIWGDVYGGSAKGKVNTTDGSTQTSGATTDVNLYGGTLHGDLYGGGLGDNTANAEIAANVYGPVTVTVESGTARNVFGCNNKYGTPKSTVEVEINGTAATIVNGETGAKTYALQGVYGGGNLAHFDPTTPGNYPTVTVSGCATSIKDVFGGGNAAAVPYTNVTINGGDIDRVFAGGNGESGTAANVGYKNSADTPSSDSYGAGTANATIKGGTINKVFGGSNSKGTVRVSGTLNIDKDSSCDMKIGEVYGGGNLAPGAASSITIGCTGALVAGESGHAAHPENIGTTLEGIGALYGGANQANVSGNISLTINSGIIANVFGGNNTSGAISGTITVNVEKTDESNTCGWYLGNVYGGGNLATYSAPQGTPNYPAVNIKNGTVSGSVYGGGKGDPADATKGVVTGNPVVTIGDNSSNTTYAVVSGNVYGGGDAAAVIGNTSVIYNDSHASSTVVNLFGGGNAAGVNGTSTVTLTNGVVTAGVYGGCNASGSVGDVTIALNGGTVGVNGTTTDVVYGGGYGHGTSTTGDIGITLNGTTVYGNLYGGSALGAVGASGKTTTLNISSNTLHGTLFGGGMGSGSSDDTRAATNGNVEINYNTANKNLTGLYGGANVNGTVAGNIVVNVKANVGASGDGNSIDIFGGGLGAATSTGGNVTVNIGDLTLDEEAPIYAPVIYGDVYGGSALGSVNDAATDETTVNVLSGTLHGNTYGGGLGEAGAANVAKGQVNGAVIVNIGATDGDTNPTYTGYATIDGDVYGCNNTNGSPKGDVTVNIYKTAHTTEDAVGYTGPSTPTYAIDNVFGGGRQADYSPVLDIEGTTSSKRATVHIYGCDNTIEDLFGGGDAAAAYGVVTIVDGGRFNRVFGGGNGEVTAANIGAGGTDLRVHGGKITQLFGGSNTSGTITGNMGISVDATGACASDMYVDEFFCGNNLANIGTSDHPVNINATIGCGTKFGDIYGGCNLADIYGNVTLTIVGGEMNYVYGGSKGRSATSDPSDSTPKAANITGNVTLNIHGGKIAQDAFGGSNINGNITGNITVNMDWSQASSGCDSDLHVGNIYGASNLAAYTPTTPGASPAVNIWNGTVSSSVYGGGKGATAVVTSNPVVTIGDITSGHESYVATITGDVYGGGDAAAVTGNTSVILQKANTTVGNAYGGGNEAAITGTTSLTMAGGSATNLYGGGNEAGVSSTATVTMTGGAVSTGIYGGCNSNGTVSGAISVNVNGGTVGTDATHLANVHGGGYGSSTATGANVMVTIGNGTSTPVIWGDVYGGSALGNVNDADAEITKVWLKSGTVNGSLYGGGLGDSTHPALVNGIVQVVVDGGTVATTSNTALTTGAVFGCNNVNGAPQQTVAVTIGGGTVGNVYGGGNLAAYTRTPVVTMANGTVSGSVYGGGLGSTASVGGTNVTTTGGTANYIFGGGEEAPVTGSVLVNIAGGTVIHDVYGGGALAHTNTANWTGSALNADGYHEVTGLTVGTSIVTGLYTESGGVYTKITTNNEKAAESTTYYRYGTTYTTTLNLTGGTIGNAYGGGLGQKNGVNGATSDIEAMVYGDVSVIVDGTAFTKLTETVGEKQVPTTGRVFGCNNLQGTPKGNVNVTVYRTNSNERPNKLSTSFEYDNPEWFELVAVYGGGNQAHYVPVTGKNTQVNIHGCSQTSIMQVYGSGNSADVPTSDVTIWGSYVIGSVFGGGNGSEPGSPGANVTGLAKITLKGGEIYDMFGGSNTKGECGSTEINDKDTSGGECDLKIRNMYGAGKSADVIGNVTIDIGCNTSEGVNVYAGSYDAKIFGSVTLNITGGILNNVYSGNNLGGSIGGPVVVNVEEIDDCKPIIINSLYGGGNRAAYPGAGAKKYIGPETATDAQKADPNNYTDVDKGNITINIRSCTHIGNVFGGGFGSNATVTGDTEVNINMTKGYWANRSYSFSYESLGITKTDDTAIKADIEAEIPNIVASDINTTAKTFTATINDAIGTIGSVYGGGNEGAVTGKAVINIGSDTKTYYAAKEPVHLRSDSSTPLTPIASGEHQGTYEATVLGAHITGDVFGGGNKAEVQGNTYVNISTKMTETTPGSGDYTYAAVDYSGTTDYEGISIGESVYGGGCEADVKGNTHVEMADGYVYDGVYGGGLKGSIGTFTRALPDGHPTHDGCVGGKPDVFTANTGKCTVIVSGGQVGPVEAALTNGGMKNTGNLAGYEGGPVDVGFVFGAGRGEVENPDDDPDADFHTYVRETEVIIKNRYAAGYASAADSLDHVVTSPLIMASVYGGGENGRVRGNTLVKIYGGQIGCGEGKTEVVGGKTVPKPYTEAEFIDPTTTPVTGGVGGNALAECSHWDYGKTVGTNVVYETYDPYADDVPGLFPGGSTAHASDGKTYYGCVFGGGSGYYPYVKAESGGKVTDYDWLPSAGAVEGNTKVLISGGHILTNVYGGNEYTYVNGSCTVKMTGGTLGVPRTIEQIAAHPLTCYIFGGGKGDPRSHFNESTNVGSVNVEVSGGIIYGSVFGGAEDGHVIGDVDVQIKPGATIGTWGTSYVDGNVFGGGRGFSGENVLAGNVGGDITVTISGGKMLGSIYGGGRLGSVGLDPNSGEMQADIADDTETPDVNESQSHGHVTINITGGTIGNTNEYKYIAPDVTGAALTTATANMPNTLLESNNRLKHTKGGNVFAGGMGRRKKLDGVTDITDWTKLGNAKSTKLTISGADTWIMGNVYGGGEFGAVTGRHTTKDAQNNDINVGTEIIVTGGTIGTEITETTPQRATVETANTVKYTFGSVYGGGMGVEEHDASDNHGGSVTSNTSVSISGENTKVRASVYGGGEMAVVEQNTYVTISAGEIGRNEVKPADDSDAGYVMFGGATMGNVYGGGKGHVDHTLAGLVKGDTYVTISGGSIYHNVYGGGALGSVGTFALADKVSYIPDGVPLTPWTSGGTANVTITGGTIGISGRDNGMVNGSSRGNVAKPVAATMGNPSATIYKDPYDKVAWIKDSRVTIGTEGASTGPSIKGSVYGGGENGHNAGDAYVTVYSGTIGIPETDTSDPWRTFTNPAIAEKALVTRGNIYGAGCGTDTYTGDDSKEHYNAWAGLVAGNTHITVLGGQVTNNVYGGGSMGSVGTIISDIDGTSSQHRSADNANLTLATTLYDFGLSWPMEITYGSNTGTADVNTGLAEVTIDGTAQIDNYVFGAARGRVDFGVSDITEQRYEEAKFANVRETRVTIGTTGSPTIRTVYGGGEDGHVYENASVTINGGAIARTVFGGGKGLSTFKSTLWDANNAGNNKKDPSDSSKDLVEDVHSWTAGKVYGNTTVTINGGSVGWFVYGGGNMASVGKGNYAGGADDYAPKGYGELPSVNGNLWTTAYTAQNQTKDLPWHFLNSGITTVNILGGTVGASTGANVNGVNKSYEESGVPYGSVFGGSRGKAAASCNLSPRYRYVPDFFLGYVNKAIVNIGGTSASSPSASSPTIYGSVYGGGQDGHVRNSTEVHIFKGNIAGQNSAVDTDERSGHVFGAGSGIGTYDTGTKDSHDDPITACNNSSGSVTCTTLVEVFGENSDNEATATTKIKGNIYGGGAMASVGPPNTGAPNGQGFEEFEDLTNYTRTGTYSSYSTHGSKSYTQVNINGGRIGGSVFAASRGPSDSFRQQSFEGKGFDYDPYSFATVLWPNVHVSGGNILGSVYGGGETGYVKCGVNVDITGGTIQNDVYGGGAMANTNTSNLTQNKQTSLWSWTDNTQRTAKYTTTVNLLGGTIGGDAYGGGLGRNALPAVGTSGSPGYKPAVTEVEAIVYGDVKVNLNGLETADYVEGIHGATTGEGSRWTDVADGYQVKSTLLGCVVDRVFGCNNLKGSPQGKVRVHVFATQNKDKTSISDKKAFAADNVALYDMRGVYGGGDLAPYMPMGPAAPGSTTTITTDYEHTTQRTEVIIDGCQLTSIYQAYGGGNAAPVPATYIQVNGTYEIFEVFGGGNGADNFSLVERDASGDPVVVWYQNPGANIGYMNYSHYDTSSNDDAHGEGTQAKPYVAVENSDAATKEMRQANYWYGQTGYGGVATTEIKGGKIHNVYGGSNKKGNISSTAVSMYESMYDDCPMVVDESYGGGKDAPIDGEVDMKMECAKGVEEIFGGAKNADVNSDINLTITNGSSLKRVFGGNNTSGAISGSITVNIEEGGCEPIRIDELYAGGYLAPYSVYGYVSDGRGGYAKQREDYGGDIGVVYQAQPLSKEEYDNTIKPSYESYLAADLTALGLSSTATDEAVNEKIAEQRAIAEDGTKTEAQRTAASALMEKGLEALAIRQLLASTPKKDPRINIISATYIGNIYGGGYRAKVVGNPHVNVNMTYGKVEVEDKGTGGTPDWQDAHGTSYTGERTQSYHVTVAGTRVNLQRVKIIDESVLPSEETSAYEETVGSDIYAYRDSENNYYKVSTVHSKYWVTLPIGTIGNIYGGGNLADIDGDTYVEIGTGKWLTWDGEGNPVWETTDASGAKYTYKIASGDEAVTYTQAECNEYNYSDNPVHVAGIIGSATQLTAAQASAVNSALGTSYAENDVIYMEDAVAYNAQLSGYYTTATVKTAAVNYTQAEADTHNAALPNYIASGATLTAAQAADVNTSLGLTDDAYSENGVISAAHAAAFNAKLPGYVTTDDVKTPAVYYTQAECNEHNAALPGYIGSGTELTAQQAILVNDALGTSYAAGGVIYPKDAVAYNSTLEGYITTDDVKTPAVWTWYNANNDPLTGSVIPTPSRNAATITGNVFGGGQGRALDSGDGAFQCAEAMIGEVNSGKGSTSVIIGNGTIGTIESGKLKAGTGNVYGGGKIARVENNTSVTIGLGTEEGTSAPIILGSVFGGGQGIYTHGYSGLVRGNSTVTVQNHAKVGRSVYGGGEMASVGKYSLDADGLPVSLVSDNRGICRVIVKDYAEIGPDDMKMTADGGSDDTGYIFGACRGVLPYKDPDYKDIDFTSTSNTDGKPYRVAPSNAPEYYTDEAKYLKYIETLALATRTEVTVGGHAFVKGSVYGGSENGIVQHHTHVTIQEDCQIGNGYVQMADNGTRLAEPFALNRRYTAAEWAAGRLYVDGDPDIDLSNPAEAALKAAVGSYYQNSLPECASWEYKAPYAPYDVFNLDANDKPKHATDGHTFYGNVFGGGSGLFPYKRKLGWTKDPTRSDKEGRPVDANGYSDGLWHQNAGAVFGNTVVEIKGGHILTSVYGGNELTNVGKADNDATGISTVKMSGGTLGVPRTLGQIAAHPVTCYLFGAGKGDQRVNFNNQTNVNSVVVEITDEARVYGSVFGGGEDGHVLGDVQLDVKSGKIVGTGAAAIRYPYIGTWGTSYVDGNIFGAGRGFGGDDVTAGSVGGNVEVNITDGTMLGSVYGGGRLASVGIGFDAVTSSTYGQFSEDTDSKTYGHVTVNIGGGTIGNDRENQFYCVEVETNGQTVAQIDAAKNAALTDKKAADFIPNTDFELYDSLLCDGSTTKYKYLYRLAHAKGGNVFGGSMGRLTKLDNTFNELWPQLGQVKTATVNIYGDNTVIKNSVYGGAELGTVRDNTLVVIGKTSKTDTATPTKPTIERDVYGGGYGSTIQEEASRAIVTSKDASNNTHTYGYIPLLWSGIVGIGSEVDVYGGWVKKSIYGGGEMASVGIINYEIEDVVGTLTSQDQAFNSSGTKKYKNIVKHAEEDADKSFALSWPYEVQYVTVPSGPSYLGTAAVNIFGGRVGLTGKDFMGPFNASGQPLDITDDYAVLDKNTEPGKTKYKNARIDNGDIFGGGKGVAGDRYKMAFSGNVGSSTVTIAYPEDNAATPENYKTASGTSYLYDCITGSVYGGAENGHVMGNASLTLTRGLVGHAIYGGGKGKGTFQKELLKIGKTEGSTNPDDYHTVGIYSITAGKVYGNTSVTMSGGYVVRNVYGGGNMGSVGKGNYAAGSDDYYPAGYGETLNGASADADKTLWDGGNANSLAFMNSGKATVTVTGGQVGYIKAGDPDDSMKDGLPYGNVFGGCRGESAPNIQESPRYHYSPEFFSGYVNETDVTIGDGKYRCTTAYGEGDGAHTVGELISGDAFKALSPADAANWTLYGPTILGSVYGGGQDGHVRRDATVTINSGEIGMAYGAEALKAKNGSYITDLDSPHWLHRGNVYGAGSGIGKYKYDFNADGRYTLAVGDNEEDETKIQTWDYINPLRPTAPATTMKEIDYSTSAGSVSRFTKVEINGGTIYRNVYGGGSVGSVGPPTIPPTRQDLAEKPGFPVDNHGVGWQSLNEVIIRATVGSPTNYNEVYGGEVYGGSRGMARLDGNQFATSVWTLVNIFDGANIKGNVFGGGDAGLVKKDTEVRIGYAEEPAVTP